MSERGWLLCIALAGCGLSEEPGPRPAHHDAISVRDGRLVFAEQGAFSAMLDELNALPAGTVPAAYVEANIAGFHALGAASDELALAPALRGILSKDRLFQVGGRIHLLGDRRELVIPEENAWLLPELLRGASGEDRAAAGLIEIYGQRADVEPGDDGTRALLSAKYQEHFQRFDGTVFKLIDEAYMDTFSTSIQVCLRAKLEYLKGTTWKAAGERTLKRISNGELSAKDTTTLPVIDTVIQTVSGEETSSTNMVRCKAFSPAPGHCMNDFRIDADYFSVVLPYDFTYSVHAAWDDEFDSIHKCN